MMSQYGVAYARTEPGEGDGAKQSMKDECDIEGILMRYKTTGLLEHVASGVPEFVDVTELGDFRSVLDKVRSVSEYFAGLPAEARRSFNDDPRLFMEYLETGPSPEDLEARGMAAIGDRRSVEPLRRASDVEPVVEPVVAPVVVPPLVDPPSTVPT